MSVQQRVASGVAGIMLLAACGSDDESGGDAAAADATAATETHAAEPEAAPADLSATTVRPGRASWATGYFQNAVYALLLEELGYTVADPSLNEYPPAEAYLEMASGTFDFWANGWYSQHYTWHEQTLADGSLAGDNLIVVGNQIPSGALEGLVITKSVADEHGITSLQQINDDLELAALFDRDGDGLGEVHGCPEDWTCDDIIQEMIDFNGWTNLEQTKAGYPGLVAASIDLVESGEPAIQYTWSPSGYLTRLIPGESVYWLSLGGQDKVLDGSTPGGFDFASADAAQLGGDCSDDPCWLGWEPADIMVTANAEFAAANPVAMALFEVVELSIADIAAQNVRYDEGENTEADVQRHAAEWVAANRSTVDQWLATASAAGS